MLTQPVHSPVPSSSGVRGPAVVPEPPCEPAAASLLQAQMAGKVEALRRSFNNGASRTREWRERQLDGVLRFLLECEGEILDALLRDLGKPRTEAWVAEVRGVQRMIEGLRGDLNYALKPQRVSTIPSQKPGKAFIQREALGVILVISPWNFPVELALTPLCGALAAGNCVLLKPSEVSPATSSLLARRLPDYLDPGSVIVVEGGVAEATALLAQKFDHIVYTGNSQVGRIVMRAAAEHLTPVTLELGGKSPCVVDKRANLRVAARRILWGKAFNCGQICVAPDYVLVHADVRDAFLQEVQRALVEFFGETALVSADLARIVNLGHHRRLQRLLSSGGRVLVGGNFDEAQLTMEPTVLVDVPEDAAIMQEEIFGPLLPVLTVQSLDEAIAFINARPKPLAAYLFSEDKAVQRRMVEETSSGGVTINHILRHILGPHLPFGGVGESGMGHYHGRYSIDAFSNLKAVMKMSTAMDPSFAYAPYTPSKEKWLRFLS